MIVECGGKGLKLTDWDREVTIGLMSLFKRMKAMHLCMNNIQLPFQCFIFRHCSVTTIQSAEQKVTALHNVTSVVLP